MYKYPIFFLLLLWLPVVISAQNQSSPSIIDNYVQIGVESNLQLLNDAFDGEISRSELRSARGRFLPEISFESSYTFSDGGRTVDIPTGDLFNPVHHTLNELTGEQRFPANLSNVSEQLLPNDFHDTRLRIVQPLFNTDLYYSYRAQQNLVSEQEARRQVMVDELTREIKVSYLNYFKATDLLAIHETNRELFNELIRTTESMVRNGMETPDAVLTAEYELADVEGRIAEARRQQSAARTYFNFLLNRNLDTPIRQDDSYLARAAGYQDIPALQEEALMSRPEFDQISHGIRATENHLKLNRANTLPDLFVVGDYGYQGTQYKFNSDQQYWSVQFGLRWSLFEGFRNRERIQQSHIELRKLDNQFTELEQQIRLRVMDAWHAWSAAETKLEAAESGLEAAEAGFEITRRKYEENRVLLVQYLRAQDNYTRARLQVAIARYDLKSKEADLERETGRSFTNN
ncbi:TolC family protein [Rhodohalobacter sp. SW132]|uniref:TolC family protein n=1 Tax=Rhodohalobacter sp. SW132 TaxID=2293433 RepID=UPI000E286D30|nr:TolC family protein [Rhodohalobacter sp. SW132]REL32916.1 TolC family protein [Rhodohalobacter sp. SW132]